MEYQSMKTNIYILQKYKLINSKVTLKINDKEVSMTPNELALEYFNADNVYEMELRESKVGQEYSSTVYTEQYLTLQELVTIFDNDTYGKYPVVKLVLKKLYYPIPDPPKEENPDDDNKEDDDPIEEIDGSDTDLLQMVQNDGLKIKYIKDDYKEKEICIAAVKENVLAFKYIPDSKLSYDICLEAVKNDGIILYHIPSKYIDYNLCLEAVKTNGAAYYYVPDGYRKDELKTEALKENGMALRYMRNNVTEDMILIAVSNRGTALEYVSDAYRTKEVCLIAYKQDNSCIGSIPAKFIDEILNDETEFDNSGDNEEEDITEK